MLKRALVIVAVLCAVASAGQVATVNGVKVEIGERLFMSAPVTFHDVKFYASKAVGTGEPGIVVSGYVVSMLPDNRYGIRVRIAMWENFKDVSVPCDTIAFSIDAPEPKRRIRFTAFSTAKPTTVTGVQIEYLIERLSAQGGAQVQQ